MTLILTSIAVSIVLTLAAISLVFEENSPQEVREHLRNSWFKVRGRTRAILARPGRLRHVHGQLRNP